MNLTDAEALLTRIYQKELQHYVQALAAAREVSLALAQGRNTEACLERLSAPLDEVARLEREIVTAKQICQQSGRQAGPELREVLNRLTGVIEELVPLVGSLEREAETQKSRLAPELDSVVRAQQMQRAYGTVRGR
jgi:uncharacterized membrane protein YccC